MSLTNEKKPAEQDIVNGVLQGNAPAFGLLIKHTEGLVTQIVFKMITRPEDRKDIVQDIYLKAFKNLAGFKFRSKLSTWIGQIAFNTCANYLEKKKLVLTIDEYGQDEINNVVYNESELTIVQEELKAILAASIEKLAPIYKTLITLYHQEELSYADIAEITGLPEGTVKSYLFRARKTLKDTLLSQYKKDEL